MNYKIYLIAFLFPVISFSQPTADYYIISDPQRYTIYDQYQQPLSAADKAALAPFSPLRIVEPDVLLGDQITHALKFSLQQQIFYLLKEEGGAFSGEKGNNGRTVYRACGVVEDTVDVVGNGMSMTEGSGKNTAVGRGAKLRRIFRSGRRYYIATVNERPAYGWSTLEPASAWRKGRMAAASAGGKDSGLSATIRDRILARFATANESYKKGFSHFNTLTGDEKAIPQWRCECGGDRMHCTLSGPYKDGEQLAESSKYLAQEIENILIGTDFGVVCKNGEMVIEKRPSTN